MNVCNSLHDALIIENPGRFWKIWQFEFAVKKSQPVTINGKNCMAEIANGVANYFSQAYTFNFDRRNVELRNSFDNLKMTYEVDISRA